MASHSSNEEQPIAYPTLRALLPGKAGVEEHAAAIDRLVLQTYGRNRLLSAPQRRERLELWKLSNLMRQMDTLADVQVFELGFRCPEQLKSYERALQALLDRAEALRLDRAAMVRVRVVQERVEEVCTATTRFCESLS